MNFNLKAPCGNCPFKKKGAIELRPGRVQGIKDDLLGNDYNTFPCHKTTYGAASEESACAGAMIYLLKRNRPSVLMRLAAMMNNLNYAPLLAQAERIIE